MEQLQVAQYVHALLRTLIIERVFIHDPCELGLVDLVLFQECLVEALTDLLC